ncbi:GNAT family N-acetyltransferase [Pokkaliibacter plantistimulans]|uniref:GNAT family N-acetyltransferase n=1 Tax=Proteobacteria bacterium 228 TaxID=2083153 RepID=A0A2S5KI75_9PROT|nr:GNAT family N-acetyltransferase [Pokkaliibacter plantistimulans]PPC74488.1 GNAT family N-acetyltransferase [Pokkaliibacter plantistimulans]
MSTVLLDKDRHDRTRFNCGVDALNSYLRMMAGQQARRDNSRTFVLPDAANESQIIGFYTLTMTPIDLRALPEALQKKHHSSTSAGLIARLAVDQRYRGQGWGEWLLIDALKKLLHASDTVGFPLVVVDAKDGARDFYTKYGFTAFHDLDYKLFISMAEIRASFAR